MMAKETAKQVAADHEWWKECLPQGWETYGFSYRNTAIVVGPNGLRVELNTKTRADMMALRAQLSEMRIERDRMKMALERINRWEGEFPATGRFWDDVPPNGKCEQPMSYSACYGSNGERDFMRRVAGDALKDPALVWVTEEVPGVKEYRWLISMDKSRDHPKRDLFHRDGQYESPKFQTQAEAIKWCTDNGLPYQTESGEP